MLVYDQGGNLVDNKTMPNEAKISKEANVCSGVIRKKARGHKIMHQKYASL
jgi:hypothetical protein